MYEEKNKKTKMEIKLSKIKISNTSILKKIDWKKLGIKLSMLFFCMLLLIFIVARLNKYQKTENEIFESNLDKLTKATAEYFISNPLPNNIGDSVSLVLKEMIELKLIDEVKNNHEKTCNKENSYIITTKTGKEEYHLKIYLECPEKKKVAEKKITCIDKHCIIKK